MSVLIDLTDRRFGRLIAQTFTREGKRTYWTCLCDCGATHRAETNNLRRGKMKSCGCLNAELASSRNSTHGMTGTSVYRSWRSMIARCENPGDTAYPKYGGRGISVCEQWRNSFEAFFDDMGSPPTPTHTLDREENSGNYEPNNCRWATKREQANNTRRNVRHELGGESLTMREWSEKTGVPEITIRKRMQAGHPFAVAISRANLRYGSVIQSLRAQVVRD